MKLMMLVYLQDCIHNDDIMLSIRDFGIGDLVYIKKKPKTVYSWHVKHPRTNFIGLVLNKIDGWSYSMVYLRIIYPEKSVFNWSQWNISQRKKNYWDYDVLDLKEKVDIDKLDNDTYTKILSKLL